MNPSLIFTARVVTGSHRGRTMGSPTLNLHLDDVPKELTHGIYACFALFGTSGERMNAVMHYGPRPVFQDSETCEVHILDRRIPSPPATLTVTVVRFMRSVSDFPTSEELMKQIATDISAARGILDEVADTL